MAHWETEVFDMNNSLIGYTEYNNTIDMFSVPIFKSKDRLNSWWINKNVFDRNKCTEIKTVFLKCSHGKVKKDIYWNPVGKYGVACKMEEIENDEWIK